MFEVDILLPAMAIFYRTKDYEMLDKYFSECENKNNLSSLLSQMLYYMANKNDAKCKKTLIEISKKNPYVICFIANVGNAYEIIDNIDSIELKTYYEYLKSSLNEESSYPILPDQCLP